jgi:hypothetical protein
MDRQMGQIACPVTSQRELHSELHLKVRSSQLNDRLSSSRGMTRLANGHHAHNEQQEAGVRLFVERLQNHDRLFWSTCAWRR